MEYSNTCIFKVKQSSKGLPVPDPEDPGKASSGSNNPGRVWQYPILEIQAVHHQGQAVQEEWDNV
jgi:hypothetical protein